jgi:hypothetical protein
MDVVPETVNQIINRAASDNMNSIDKAVSQAYQKVRKLKDYDKFVHLLVIEAVRHRIHDVRRYTNVCIRNEVMGDGNKIPNRGLPGNSSSEPATVPMPKVVVGNNRNIQRITSSAYNYFLAGRTLGSLKGCELPEVEDRELAMANGHNANVQLIRLLRNRVTGEKRVREVVPEKQLRKLFTQCRIKFSAA